MRLSPNPPWILYHGGVVRVKKKLARGLKKICEVLHTPATISPFLPTFDTKCRHFASRPPEFAADIFHVWLKIILDLQLLAMYNIDMKLRNRLSKFKVKHRLYCASDVWKRYDMLITMIGFWAVVLTLLALEARGII
jgi:hypothetical protein